MEQIELLAKHYRRGVKFLIDWSEPIALCIKNTYDLTAWSYYSEYSVHQAGWYATSWAQGKNIPVLSEWANRFEKAEITVGQIDERPTVKFETIAWGIMGL